MKTPERRKKETPRWKAEICMEDSLSPWNVRCQ